MGKIQVLSDLLANKIAAGEVVERPASVIKELLENAIDANSTEIVIEIENGGLDLIKVSDNGVGMEREDALLAFERHATSKIRSEKDLFRIRTLGFRGEALPSIASVSKVEVKTRTAEANEGTLVKIEGGQLVTHGVTAAKKGTDFAVRDLFFNTPARLKYLKTIQTELHHMLDYVNRLSLAHPEISFRMYHNGRQLLQSPGDGELLHAVAAIYGNDVARQMLPIEWSDYDYKIVGAVGFPELNRANRNHCSFIVNGRYVKSYQLLNAVQAAYHTRLPINRYPVCVIAVELDPSLVDVNVHPQKLEVRFSEERDVTHAVQQAVEKALQQQTFIPKATAKSVQTELKEKTQQTAFDLPLPKSEVPTAPARATGFQPANRTTYATSGSEPSVGVNGPKYKEPLPNGGAVVRETPTEYQPSRRRDDRRELPLRHQVDAALSVYEKAEQPVPTQTTSQAQSADQVQLTNQAQPLSSEPFSHTNETPLSVPVPESVLDLNSQPTSVVGESAQENFADAAPARPNMPQFRPVAQVLGMYVIAQDDTGMYIIDQHAAHEKVLYEKFTKKLADRQIQPLPLLVPLTVELTASEAALFEQRISDFADCQIEVDQFGGTTFLIRSVPDIWEGLQTQFLLQELIDELLQEGATPDPRQLIEAKVITKACKSAIKANHWLSMPEMVALCDQLRELDNPFTCPHGRPIIIHMSTYDLEKQFKRVM
ncbi:DNA mismatch repair endonuclease MutL [Tumebacillus sp. ITR2]|uniref:DNA mismatch repair protein MutL n=1 Tax=Tumebacillus amylolyticus TaxID=2801339 RepID=A0ABS1JCI3_9BACL|nr:DNA mismatch repair endonuclease MutL [Tumebacillus amylolyticus]MBL0387983.1 DNA mismatch repair endonuclease MutL [Tumebacillus amylolyticus]